MTNAMRKFGKAVGPILGAVTVVAAGKAALSIVNLASSIEEMQAKSDVVFGRFAGQVRGQLQEFGDEVGRSAFELEGMAASIQDTFVPMGFARGEAADLSVQLTKLATDVASFNNESDPEVMAAFQSALVGNHETVRRFGVIITEATIKQELMRMGITKNIKEVTNAEKVQARLNLLLAGTTDAQGDAARTSGSFANQSRALSASLKDLGNEIGQTLLPAATAFVASLNDMTIGLKEFLFFMGLIDPENLTKIAILQKRINELQLEQAEIPNKGSGKFLLAQQEIDNLQKELNLLKAIEGQRKAGELRAKLEAQANAPTFVDMVGPTSRPEDIPISKRAEEQANALNDLKNSLADMREETIQARLASSGLTEVQKQVTEFILENKNATSAQIEEFQKLAQETFNLKQNNEGLTETEKDLATTLDESTSPAMQRAIDFVNEMNLGSLRLRELELGLIEAFLEGAITLDEYTDALDKMRGKTEEVAQVNEATAEMVRTFQSSVQTASKGISDSFADMLMSGKLNMESLKGVFDNMVKTIISKAFELMVVNRIMNGIFGGVTGFTPLPTMGGGGIGASAGGGSISAPTLVGERGPELFVPHSAGVIKNAHDTRGMMGGSPVIVNQNLNIETGVAQTVRAEILTMMPMIQNSTLSAVQNARQRGGSFATSFGG